MRHFVEEDDPLLARARDVHDLVAAQPAMLRDVERAHARLDRQDLSFRPRRILRAAQNDEQNRAKRDPPRVEPAKHFAIIRIVTRDEIAEKLLSIVKAEK